MAKISVSNLIAYFRLMYQEHWSYGVDTKYGQVDCSGAFVWAYNQEGHGIYHGSNRIARTEVLQLIPIKQATIKPGMAAFKRRDPGSSGYSLPSSYQTGGSNYNGDLGDYYHIGLVAEDTSKVYNAQSSATGFVASDIFKGWTHVAYLSQVDYNGEEVSYTPLPEVSSPSPTPAPSVSEPVVDTAPVSYGTAVVRAEMGKSVKMRNKPSKTERLYWDVPVGAVVDITGPEKSGWTPIRYGARKGWMMTEYLDFGLEEVIEPAPSEKLWSVTIVDLSLDEATMLLNKYPGRSILGESNG